MAENTNTQVSQEQEQALAALQQRQMAILGHAAEKVGLDPQNPKHQAAFEAHIKEFGEIKNEEELAKLHEKVGMDYKGFQQQFGNAVKSHQAGAQQTLAQLEKMDKDYTALATESETLTKKKSTRNIITAVMWAVGAVGGYFASAKLITKNWEPKTWKRGLTNAGVAIVGGIIGGKTTQALAVRPVERKIETLKTQAEQLKQQGAEMQNSLSMNETKLMNEQEIFQVEFHTRALQAKLAEQDKAASHAHHAGHGGHHAPQQHNSHHAPHAAPSSAPRQDAPATTPTPEEQAKIEAERQEGIKFTQKDAVEAAPHQQAAAGAPVQQLGEQKEVVVEKKKEPWDIAPRTGNFTAREAAPAVTHAQDAIESKLAANQQVVGM